MATTSFDRENLNEDVERMRVLWVNEMNAPEVLPYNDDMVTEMLDQIRNQQEYVDSVYEDREQLTDERAFVNKLYQMEIDRLRFMVSSYLRVRLQKIETFAAHILADPMRAQRLSPKERDFAQQYVMLFKSHMDELVLDKLAEDHRSLADGGMMPEPNLDCFVFCQSTTDLARVQTDDRGAEDIPVHARDRIVLRYRSVQEYVASGDMTLI